MSGLKNAVRVGVARKKQEAKDICSFELVSVAGDALPEFAAGAHIDVLIPGERQLVRQYSLVNASRERNRYVIAVLREEKSRGGSQAMHEHVMEGDVLQISPPRNHFALAAETAEGHSLLIAGGIGITPILSMAEQLARDDAAFDLHYCVRSDDRMAFRSRLEQAPFAGYVHLHVSSGTTGARLDIESLLRHPTPKKHLYVCGPERFLEAVTAAARASGWTQGHVHFEHFNRQVEASGTDAAAFELQLARSGRSIRVAADQTVAAALAQHGIDLPVSCEQGVCGTCLTRVLEGVPDHKDVYLTPDEQARNDQFTPCCSRSKTPRLVIDL